jgi:hypothetical protein
MVRTPASRIHQVISKEQVLERRLVDLRITGQELSHTRTNNLEVIERLLHNDPHLTFGMKIVEEAVSAGSLDQEAVLKIISGITKCSNDVGFESGLGFISPKATLSGLRRAGGLLQKTAEQGGVIAFGTGHPGALVQFHQALANMAREWGGRVAHPAGCAKLTERLHLDFIGDVALASDTCGAPHSHDCQFMERFIESFPGKIDLVVADHGFVGPAVNRGIPVIAIMDTNDPAIAVAKHLGADITIVPMNDNRPNCVLEEAARVIRQMFA